MTHSPCVGSADLVIDNVLGRLAECEGFGAGPGRSSVQGQSTVDFVLALEIYSLLAAGVLVVDGFTLLLVGEASHDSAQSIGTSAKCQLEDGGERNSHLSTIPILNEVVVFWVIGWM